jgi:predicted O-linked N-acetylglucosamine transferase (SPINDLY family)
MADSLYVRKLMVSCQGDRWYNRIGPQMLRVAGLPELIANSPAEYVDLVVRLIHDDAYRPVLEDRLRQADLKNTVFNRADAKYFRKTIDYLIANQETLRKEPDRSPVRIERDSS